MCPNRMLHSSIKSTFRRIKTLYVTAMDSSHMPNWSFPKTGVPPNHPTMRFYAILVVIETHGFGDPPF